MTYETFVGQVQEKAHLTSRGEAVRAIHATLCTLSERISGSESRELSSQLPEEIAFYLRRDAWRTPDPFTVHHFYNRVGSRESVEYSEAVFHARVVMRVLAESVSRREISRVRAQLPHTFDSLFELPSEYAGSQ